MKKLIKASVEPPMHRILVTVFDPDMDPSPTEDDVISQRSYTFDDWQACEDFLERNDYTDPDMFTDAPEVNKTGVYIEHVPRWDAEEQDPYYRQFLRHAGFSGEVI